MAETNSSWVLFMQEKMRRMTPEQREKYEARKAKVEEKRNQKKFVKRG